MPQPQDLLQLKRMSTLRVSAQLSPLEVIIINVMRKRNYGDLTIYFQDGIPYRYESKESSLVLAGPDGQEVLGKIVQTKQS